MGPSAFQILTHPGVWVIALAIAGFLVLTWALRGAPLGQRIDDEEEGEGRPDPRLRDRAVGLAVGGMLLVALGAYLAIGVGVPWSVPAFAAGYGMLGYVVRAFRVYRHDSPTLRRVVTVSDTAMTAGLLGGVLIVGNVLAFKFAERPIDFTKEKTYSLSRLTTTQLRGLQKPVKFIVFFGKSPLASRQFERVYQLLELYKAENPGKISQEVLQAYSDPRRFEDLARRVPEVAVTPLGGVVIEEGEGEAAARTVVRNSEMFERTPGDAYSSDPSRLQSTFRGEDAITSALIRLKEGKRSKIAFLTGHGEPSVHELGMTKAGLGTLRARLESLGSEVVVHNLAREALPAGTSVLIIVSPSKAVSAQEADRLKAFMAAGGHLVLLLNGRNPTGLEEWLKAEFHIEVGRDPILDPNYNLLNRWDLVVAPIVGDSHQAIVEPLLNQRVAVPYATPLTETEPSTGMAASKFPFVNEIILRTSSDSWAETDLTSGRPSLDPGKDRPGPLPVGIAVSDAPKPGGRPSEERGRMVVFSSPNMADNQFLSGAFANMDLVVNSIQWLRGRSDLGGIAPKTHVALRLTASPNLRWRIVAIPTLISVAVILILGVSTYLARRG